jgi:hypothetical protein
MSSTDSKFHKRCDPEYNKGIVRLVEELGKSPVDVAKGVTFVQPHTLKSCF